VTRSWHDVTSVEQLRRDGAVVTRIGGREIGVLMDGDEPKAIRNRCPHMGAPLCLGTVRRRETGAPGSYRLEDRRVLHCPWHGWEFDLDSGVCPDDARMRAAVYPVQVRDGRILVEA
jgi:nitrite reductase/ring-hydroxylating ferredoxin subunit